jgi:hypothetical protein
VIQTKRVNEFAASRVARREDLLEVTQRDSHFGCELREIGSRLCHGNPCACHRFSRPAFGVFRATRVRKTVATVNERCVCCIQAIRRWRDYSRRRRASSPKRATSACEVSQQTRTSGQPPLARERGCHPPDQTADGGLDCIKQNDAIDWLSIRTAWSTTDCVAAHSTIPPRR